jgi:hypothetical protein
MMTTVINLKRTQYVNVIIPIVRKNANLSFSQQPKNIKDLKC